MAASPTLATLLAAIATAAKAAMNPGTPSAVTTVHIRRRFWRDRQQFDSIFRRPTADLLPGKINGWHIWRAGTVPIEAEERWRFYQIHRFHIEGFMGILDGDSDPNQSVFRDQVEVLRDNLRLNTSVFGNTERTVPDTTVEVDAEPILVGDSTCWHAILSLEAEAIETKTL